MSLESVASWDGAGKEMKLVRGHAEGRPERRQESYTPRREKEALESLDIGSHDRPAGMKIVAGGGRQSTESHVLHLFGRDLRRLWGREVRSRVAPRARKESRSRVSQRVLNVASSSRVP